jgi:hypothetical protein
LLSTLLTGLAADFGAGFRAGLRADFLALAMVSDDLFDFRMMRPGAIAALAK